MPPTRRCGKRDRPRNPSLGTTPASKPNNSNPVGGSWRRSSASRPSARPASRTPWKSASKPISPATVYPFSSACSTSCRTTASSTSRPPAPHANPERAALVNATQVTAYALLYRENTGRKGSRHRTAPPGQAQAAKTRGHAAAAHRRAGANPPPADHRLLRRRSGQARLHPFTGLAVCRLRVLSRMRGVALNHHLSPAARSTRRGTIQPTNHSLMKAIETVISIIAFIMLAIVLFALSPLLDQADRDGQPHESLLRQLTSWKICHQVARPGEPAARKPIHPPP